MENISYNFEDAPENFVKCLATGCTAADKCLRCRAAQALMQKDQKLLVASPAFINPEAGEGCRMFVSTQMVRVAKGFKKAMKTIRVDKVKIAVSAIKGNMSLKTFYRMRNGEICIVGEKQAEIENILIQCGAEQPIVFDRYEYVSPWECNIR